MKTQEWGPIEDLLTQAYDDTNDLEIRVPARLPGSAQASVQAPRPRLRMAAVALGSAAALGAASFGAVATLGALGGGASADSVAAGAAVPESGGSDVEGLTLDPNPAPNQPWMDAMWRVSAVSQRDPQFAAMTDDEDEGSITVYRIGGASGAITAKYVAAGGRDATVTFKPAVITQKQRAQLERIFLVQQPELRKRGIELEFLYEGEDPSGPAAIVYNPGATTPTKADLRPFEIFGQGTVEFVAEVLPEEGSPQEPPSEGEVPSWNDERPEGGE